MKPEDVRRKQQVPRVAQEEDGRSVHKVADGHALLARRETEGADAGGPTAAAQCADHTRARDSLDARRLGVVGEALRLLVRLD